MNLTQLKFPDMLMIRQKFEIPPPVDPCAGVDAAFCDLHSELRTLSGMKVAVCVGSRGIDGIVPVVKRVIEIIRASGAEVFVMPAMGSHGGATAKGQLEVLAHRGITEGSVGCSIIADMETVQIGETADGIPLFINRLAHQADASYWKEWEMFGLPGGIQLFTIFNAVAFLVLLACFASVISRDANGFQSSLLIAGLSGVVLPIHAAFAFAGFTQFHLPVSIALIFGTFIASVWQIALTFRARQEFPSGAA